jgi:hypoxia-inducible factor (prolyl hydroxylase)
MPLLQHVMDTELERLAVDQIVPSLLDQGFFYVDNFLGELVGHFVLNQVKEMHYSGVLQDGQLAGPGPFGVSKRNIRGDKIAWVNGGEKRCEAIHLLLTLIDKLVSLCIGRLGKSIIRERSKVSCATVLRKLSVSMVFEGGHCFDDRATLVGRYSTTLL